MEVDLKRLKESGLDVDDYIFLQMVYEGVNLSDYLWELPLLEMLDNFETAGYLKQMDDCIAPRQKMLDLFNIIDKNDEIVEIIQHLNTVTGSRFSVKSEANKKFIRGRLDEGYSVDDLKKVVDTMSKEWMGTKMQDYLRPETLFGAQKFQTYINKVSKVSTWSNIV